MVDFIPLFKTFVNKSADKYIRNVLSSGYLGQGEFVEKFENKLKNYIESNYILATNSGTSALQIALKLIDSSNSNIVLTTPLTCIATTNAILLDGRFNVEWIDIDPNTCNIDLNSLKQKVIQFNPAAVVIVHWGGYPNNLDEIKKICGTIPVIEDCAHAFGARYKNKLIGNHGNICAFSFQAIKTLTCGDGGAIVLPAENLYQRANKIRWYGIDRKNRDDVNNYAEVGGKWNMNNINAAIGLANTEIFNYLLDLQRYNSFFYDQRIKNSSVRLMRDDYRNDSSCWLYTISVDNLQDFERYMKDRGVEVGLHHKRNDKYSVLKDKIADLPMLDSIYNSITNIPVGWWVGDEERHYIVDCINNGW